jgi:hypothetical protein
MHRTSTPFWVDDFITVKERFSSLTLAFDVFFSKNPIKRMLVMRLMVLIAS